MAVTLICIGIPVCRPLYRRIYRHWRPDTQTSGYRKQKPQDDSFALETIGGGTMEGHKGKITSKSRELGNKSKDRDAEYGPSEDGDSFPGAEVDDLGPYTKTTTETRVGRGDERANVPDNASDEEILGSEYWRSQNQPQSYQGQQRDGRIMVTETVDVDRS
ncbi:hypothetical protein IMZ48_09980 [Candidatus Bathyarchaeota archaeon]|nr:hypothetical protein [Candidatus Bathyarchaeota archaeon]